MKVRVLHELGLGKWARWAMAINKERKKSEATSAVSDKTGDLTQVKAEGNMAQTMNELAITVSACTKCGLCKGRKQTVFGKGSQAGCEVLVIGEAPGAEEDKQGLPFVGRAGKLLGNMLLSIGLDENKQTYISNIVKCRPPDNRNPTTEEIDSCMPYLREQIRMLAPKMLLVVGKVAGNALLRPDASMADMRGKVHRIEGLPPAVATYHPAYLLRRPSEKHKSWTDLLLAKRTLDSL